MWKIKKKIRFVALHTILCQDCDKKYGEGQLAFYWFNINRNCFSATHAQHCLFLANLLTQEICYSLQIFAVRGFRRFSSENEERGGLGPYSFSYAPHLLSKKYLLSVYNVKSLPGFSRTWTSDVFVMGCSASFHHRGTTKNRSPISVSLGLKNLSIPLSRKTKITLKESWKLVEPVKSEAGKAMFMR